MSMNYDNTVDLSNKIIFFKSSNNLNLEESVDPNINQIN